MVQCLQQQLTWVCTHSLLVVVVGPSILGNLMYILLEILAGGVLEDLQLFADTVGPHLILRRHKCVVVGDSGLEHLDLQRALGQL